MTKRAVLYARVSGDDTRRDTRNVRGQLDMCRDYALERGYVIVEELHEDDRGASGASFELPQLNRVRELAQAQAFDVLVVREIDRLSRRLAKQLVVEEQLKRYGVQIDYVLGEYADTPEGNLSKHIKAVIAEYEREKITERMVRGRRLKVQSGSVIVHAFTPYGYDLVEKDGKWQLEVNEEQARIVRLVFAWYTGRSEERQPLSLRAIMARLKEMGAPTQGDTNPRRAKVTTKVRGRAIWARSTLHSMIDNETYVGTWYYGKYRKHNDRYSFNPRDHWLPVAVPAIVERDVWDAAQARRAQNKADSPRSLKHDYLLRRRVYCSQCGRKMTAKTTLPDGVPYTYYVCMFHWEKPPVCTMSTHFRATHVDRVVWQWVKQLLVDPTLLADGLQNIETGQEQARLPLRERLAIVEDLLQDNQSQLNRLMDLYLSGEIEKEMLLDRKRRLEATISALSSEQQALSERLADYELSPHMIENLQAFARQVGAGLTEADESLDVQLSVVELLNVEATLAVEDGQKVVYARCLVGAADLSLGEPSRQSGKGETGDEDKSLSLVSTTTGSFDHESAHRR
ncbi:MAG: recombinase family protein [Anaerolineae bacterium]